MTLPRVAPKSRNLVSGSTHNAMVDLIEDLRGRSASTGGGTPALSSGLLVRNDSGADVPRFGVLAISGVVFDPSADAANLPQFLDQPVVIGDTPDPAAYSAFVVTQEPIASGGFGRAVVNGITVAALDDGSTAATTAGMGSTTGELVAGEPGTLIVWTDGSASDARALVVLGSDRHPDAAIPVDLASDGGSGTAAADFTYTPTFIDGTAVNNPDGTAVTGLTPKNRRDPALDYAAGDFGYLHRASDGTWALGWCNEAEEDASECSS